MLYDELLRSKAIQDAPITQQQQQQHDDESQDPSMLLDEPPLQREEEVTRVATLVHDHRSSNEQEEDAATIPMVPAHLMVALSSNGTIVAIGSPNGNGRDVTCSGKCSVFRLQHIHSLHLELGGCV